MAKQLKVILLILTLTLQATNPEPALNLNT